MSLPRTASRLALPLALLLGLAAPMAQAAEAPPLPPGWHRLTPSGLEDSEPFAFEHHALIQAPPEAVFEILAHSDWSKWFPDMKAVEWTSPEPHQVGSTRTVYLKDLAVQERFLAWEPGRRFSFSIDSASSPLLERMLEDLRLEPADEGRATRVTWRVTYAPSSLMSLVHPFASASFRQMVSNNLQGLKRYAEKRQKFLVD